LWKTGVKARFRPKIGQKGGRSSNKREASPRMAEKEKANALGDSGGGGNLSGRDLIGPSLLPVKGGSVPKHAWRGMLVVKEPQETQEGGKRGFVEDSHPNQLSNVRTLPP